MVLDEVKMKRIERRLDELHDLVNHYVDKGIRIPEEVRVEHRGLTDEYNAMVSKMYQQKTKEFMEEISKEQ